MHEVSERFVLLTLSSLSARKDCLFLSLAAPVPLKQIADVGGSSAMV